MVQKSFYITWQTHRGTSCDEEIKAKNEFDASKRIAKKYQGYPGLKYAAVNVLKVKQQTHWWQ